MPRRLRVLIGITGAGIGGAQGVVWDLLNHLNADKYDLTLTCPPSGDLVSRVRRLNRSGQLPPVTLVPVRSLVRNIHPIRDTVAFLYLLRLIRRGRYDIVHLHSSKMGFLGRLAAVIAGVPKILFTVHGWGFDDEQPVPQRAAWATLERVAAAVTTRIVCVSEFDLRKARKWRVCHPAKLALIRNGVADSPLVRGRLRRELGLPADQLVVGTVMRLADPKRPDMVIRTAALTRRADVPPFVTVIIGAGPRLGRCRQLAQDLGVSEAVHFLGERADARVLINDFDVFVLFSQREGMPLSVIEAMHSGRPVVASGVGGVPELVVHGESGFLVAGHEIAAAVPFISRLLADGDLRHRLGRNAADRARSLFSLERMIDQYEAEYDAG